MQGPQSPGWYARPDRPDVKRYFDGTAWTDNLAGPNTPVDALASAGAGPEPTSAGDLLLPGIALGGIGAALIAGGASNDNELVFFAGCAAAALGGLVSLTGAVAAGVRIGIRQADFEREVRGR